jgi:hypothetical protein
MALGFILSACAPQQEAPRVNVAFRFADETGLRSGLASPLANNFPASLCYFVHATGPNISEKFANDASCELDRGFGILSGTVAYGSTIEIAVPPGLTYFDVVGVEVPVGTPCGEIRFQAGNQGVYNPKRYFIGSHEITDSKKVVSFFEGSGVVELSPASNVITLTAIAKDPSNTAHSFGRHFFVRDRSGASSGCSTIFDTDAPALGSAAISNMSPTGNTSFSLTYTSQVGSYNRYCIRENSTLESSCTYTSGVLPATYTVSGTNNVKTLSIWLKDAAGNLSARVDTNSVALDTVAPSAPSALTQTSGSSPNVDPNPYFDISGVASGDYVALYADSACSTASLVSGLSSGTPVSLQLGLGADGAYNFYAQAIDPAGNLSACSTANASYVLDRVAPNNASALGWDQSTPTSVTAVNATWTKSVSGDLANQKIQFYSDAACTSQEILTPTKLRATTVPAISISRLARTLCR